MKKAIENEHGVKVGDIYCPDVFYQVVRVTAKTATFRKMANRFIKGRMFPVVNGFCPDSEEETIDSKKIKVPVSKSDRLYSHMSEAEIGRIQYLYGKLNTLVSVNWDICNEDNPCMYVEDEEKRAEVVGWVEKWREAYEAEISAILEAARIAEETRQTTAAA
jgi:hypothetical protein